jgi:hypothetical protein
MEHTTHFSEKLGIATQLLRSPHITLLGPKGHRDYAVFLVLVAVLASVAIVPIGLPLMWIVGPPKLDVPGTLAWTYVLNSLLVAPVLEGLILWFVVWGQSWFWCESNRLAFHHEVILKSLLPAFVFAAMHLPSRGALGIAIVVPGFLFACLQVFQFLRGKGGLGWAEAALVHAIYNGIVLVLRVLVS